MSARRVISRKYLPIRPVNVLSWVSIVTALHYWQAPGWMWGVVCTVVGIFTVAGWVLFWQEKEVRPSELEAKP